MKKFASALIVVAALSATAQAQWGFDVNPDTNVVLQGNGGVSGAELRSTAGGLAFGSAAPFQLDLSSTANYVALATTKKDLVIDGSLTLDVKYTGDAATDLKVDVSPLGAATPVAATYTGGVVVPPSPPTGCTAPFCFDLDPDTNIVLHNNGEVNPVGISGAEARSAAGLLAFGSAAPFQLDLSSTGEYVALATTKKDLVIDGSLTLDVKYGGDPASGDLTVDISPLGASTPVSAPYVPPVPEPATGLLAAFGLLGLLGFRRRR